MTGYDPPKERDLLEPYRFRTESPLDDVRKHISKAVGEIFGDAVYREVAGGFEVTTNMPVEFFWGLQPQVIK